ncbi:VIR protein [Plasmodium vivax]|uniref:VIR protein n=1 Tax=Plasmodium vivax TaxID=5855 RepID=A0A1G4E4P2_PLAVI|nr:VIR protein [Plasmodium vivax]
MNATSIELPSQIFYHYLNFFNEEYKQHYKECKSLNTPHNKDMKIIRTCEKLVNYLKTNYEEEENKGDLKDHHCNLLSYWIYEQLDKKIKSGFHAILPTYAEYQMILSYVLNGPNASQAHKCLRNVSVFAFDNWKERKDLYDYCVDYDKIIKLADTSYEKCKKYEKYIQEKSPLYEKFDNLYIPEYKKKNPGFYKKCKGYNPEIVIGELKCDVKFSEERSKGDSHGQGLSGSTFFSGQNSDSTKTFGNVFLGVVVTSMTSGMLYKFTPLGRRFRNGLGWNNYTASDLNNEERMLFAQTHDPFSPHSEEREHHIGYLPA